MDTSSRTLCALMAVGGQLWKGSSSAQHLHQLSFVQLSSCRQCHADHSRQHSKY